MDLEDCFLAFKLVKPFFSEGKQNTKGSKKIHFFK